MQIPHPCSARPIASKCHGHGAFQRSPFSLPPGPGTKPFKHLAITNYVLENYLERDDLDPALAGLSRGSITNCWPGALRANHGKLGHSRKIHPCAFSPATILLRHPVSEPVLQGVARPWPVSPLRTASTRSRTASTSSCSRATAPARSRPALPS